jgi:hypothetical protein
VLIVSVGVGVILLLTGIPLWALWNFNAEFKSRITGFLDGTGGLVGDPRPGTNCPIAATGTYKHAARGNEATTCSFAYVVRDQMNASPAVPTSFRAYDKDTSETITVACEVVGAEVSCSAETYLVYLR